jgi:thiol-disulfide isomerase/thioredoxin
MRIHTWLPSLALVAASQLPAAPTIVGTIDRIVARPQHGSRAEGHADIGGRMTLVSLPFDAETGRASVRGRIGVDANGDGTIDFGPFSSAEVVWSDAKPALFRVGDRVVSVESVDAAAKTFVLRVHSSDAYKYVELRVGDAMPAFAFTDFNGRARTLADFRGRYVLLDFWGTWCGPCLAEFPILRTARERFADRGFEILGIDYEKGATLDQARAVVKERNVNWPNAAPETVKELVEDVLRITAFPSKILVGPDGRVVAFLGFEVVGGELLRRLDALIRPGV